MYKIKFNTVSEINSEHYSAFCNSNYGLIFHDFRFCNIYAQTMGLELEFVELSRNNEIIGFSPVFIDKRDFCSNVYFNPPYDVPYGGFISLNDLNLNEIFNSLKPKFKEKIIYKSSIFIRNTQNITNVNIHKKETAILDLSRSEDEIFMRSIDSKRRNMIKKAIKNDIVVERIDDKYGFGKIWHIVDELHNKLGYSILKKELYYNLFLDLKKSNNFFILAAKYQDIYISVLFLIGNLYMFHYWKGATINNAPNLGQGELLQWEAIKLSKSIGSNYYDLCVVDKKLESLYKFKTDFSKNIVDFYEFSKKGVLFSPINQMEKIHDKLS